MPASVTVVSVGLFAVEALSINRLRTARALINNNSTAILYWHPTDKSVTVANGMPIFPRGSVTWSLIDGDDVTSAVYVVSDVAGQNVRVYESIP